MFDYISVDGRVRMPCLERALPLLKPEGGILLLDNSEREQYQVAFDMVPSRWLKVSGALRPALTRANPSRNTLRLCDRINPTFLCQAPRPPPRTTSLRR